MKARIALSALLISATAGCSDFGSPVPTGNPPWLDQLILQFESAPIGNPPRAIWKYHFHGQTVYYTPPQCCDQFSVLYDSTGAVLCAPDGGFTGAGDGRCPDFFQKRTDETLVWMDPRHMIR